MSLAICKQPASSMILLLPSSAATPAAAAAAGEPSVSHLSSKGDSQRVGMMWHDGLSHVHSGGT